MSQQPSVKFDDSKSYRQTNARRAKSSSSETSVCSLGIGPGEYNQYRYPNVDHVPLLVAEGEVPPNQATYDIMMFVFVCDLHNKVAILNPDRTQVVWFPFVAIPQDSAWEELAQVGVQLFLGKRQIECVDGGGQDYSIETNGNEFMKYGLPKYKSNFINVLRLQLASDAFEVRLAQCIRILQTNGYQCCQDTASLKWIEIQDILNENIQRLWGPEVKFFVSKLITKEAKFIWEFNQENALKFLIKPEKYCTFQSKLLKRAKMTSDIVMAMYEDFVEFCFPSFYMTTESFKLYLCKYGYNQKSSCFDLIFRAVSYNGKNHIDFFEYLVGIVCLEPDTENGEARRRLIFNYYDMDKDKKLNLVELEKLLKDLDPVAFRSQPKEIIQLLKNTCNIENNFLSLEEFQKAIVQGKIKGTERLFRSPKRIVPQIVLAAKLRCEDRTQRENFNLKVERRNRGSCDGCRAQVYDYAMHCVTFDSFGRCNYPKRTVNKAAVDISKEQDETVSAARYSAEYRFGVGSVSNIFLGIIRGSTYAPLTKLDDNPGDLTRFVGNLCESIIDFFLIEEKLMKINSPATIVGDILGNMESIMIIDRLFCPTVPVLQTNLVFLGNYFGNGSFNLELICYLFSLKLQCPNKVIFLRGFNEDVKQSQCYLLNDCQTKYGEEVGLAVWRHIADALEKMPFAVVIDQSVICVHSGIPQHSTRITSIENIPRSLCNIEDCSLAYELISKTPTESNEADLIKFTANQFYTFLTENSLTHMIRSHADAHTLSIGYQIAFRNQCITVCSHTATPHLVCLEPGKKICANNETVKDISATIRIIKLDP